MRTSQFTREAVRLLLRLRHHSLCITSHLFPLLITPFFPSPRFTQLLADSGAELKITTPALKEIAKEAVRKGTGARALTSRMVSQGVRNVLAR